MDLQVVTGDLLDAPEKFICHQCNCLTDHAAGIAQAIFSRFPYADIYKLRSKNHTPTLEEQLGNIIIKGNGTGQRFIINMMAQVYPGAPKYPDSRKDGTLVRQAAFQECLHKITQLPELQSVAFPWQIGCNLGGGDWQVYRHMIREFAEQVGIPVRVYKLPGM